MYVHMLARPEFALRFNNVGVPRWEDRAVRWGFPLFRRLINRVLDIRPGIEREDEAAVWRELDFVADLLSDGRPHLCGERFGAADMTFAAMSAPVDRPAGLRRSTSPAGHPAPGHRGSRRAGTRAPGWAVRPPPVRRLQAGARRLTYLASRQPPDS